MSVREWLNNNPQVSMGVAVAVVIVALVALAWQFRDVGQRSAPDAYFWDIQAGEAFVRSGDELAPIEAPSGGEGARAQLYTCGECAPDEWFGYLEKYTDDAKQRYEASGELPSAEEHFIRALDGDRWMPYYSQEGQRIIDAIYAVYDDPNAAPCGEPGVPPRQCLP